MNTKKRFLPGAALLYTVAIRPCWIALILSSALFSLAGCDMFQNVHGRSRDFLHGDGSEEEGSPLANRTFTVVPSPSPTTADEIFWNTTTNKIEIGNDTTFDEYDPLTDTAYAVLKDFLLLTGVDPGDKVTFDGGGLISGIEKVAGSTNDITIVIGTDIAAVAFASGVTLTGSAANGINVTGAVLAIGTTLVLDATVAATYDIYGVSTAVIAGSNATVTQSGANELTLDAGAAAATVAVSTTTITGIKLVTTSLTAISNASAATTINVGSISGVAITATAATTVDITGLATVDDTVALSGSSAFTVKVPAGTSPYTANFVAGTTDGSTGKPVTFTAGTGITDQFEVGCSGTETVTVGTLANDSFIFTPSASATFTVKHTVL